MEAIETEEQYQTALAIAYDLIQIDEKTKSEDDELETLVIEFEKYEKVNYPMQKPNPH